MLNIVTRAAFTEGQPIRVNGQLGRIIEVDTLSLKVEYEIPGLQNADGSPVIVTDWVDWSDVLQAMITRS